MIVESGFPLLLHISEVHHEQLSVQRIRQQQLDLDHPHRPAVPLLLRRLLIPGGIPDPHRPPSAKAEGGHPFGLLQEGTLRLLRRKIRRTYTVGSKRWQDSLNFLEKSPQDSCVFRENVV